MVDKVNLQHFSPTLLLEISNIGFMLGLAPFIRFGEIRWVSEIKTRKMACSRRDSFSGLISVVLVCHEYVPVNIHSASSRNWNRIRHFAGRIAAEGRSRRAADGIGRHYLYRNITRRHAGHMISGWHFYRCREHGDNASAIFDIIMRRFE